MIEKLIALLGITDCRGLEDKRKCTLLQIYESLGYQNDVFENIHAVWFYKKHHKISTSAVSYFGLEFQLVTVS